MASFFIDRPVFAWVIAIVIMLAGALSLNNLPVAQYPDIAPTTITIGATYPGASAKSIEDSVTQTIEQQMTGLDGLDYMSSISSSAGTSSITLTFATGTDPDIAQVQVQNKLSLATPLLPSEVQRQGVTVNKASASFLMVAALTSPNRTYDTADLGDYVRSNLIDEVSRLKGVGSVQLFGSQYAMRIWLDPNKLNKFNLIPSDITNAIQAQNAQISSGSIGGAPSVEGQEITATITLQSLLTTVDDFKKLLIRSSAEGTPIYLEDVARVEKGSENYTIEPRFNRAPAAAFAVSLATGANALETAEIVRESILSRSESFPNDIEVVFPYDTTPFIEESISSVEHTLIEAIVLVFLVIFIFLQSLRASFIPMIAVPVVLLGTFAVLSVFGYSINMLTMFAMVLAIGLLVDDAIVVVENVERVMEEDGLSPIDATRKSMGQITGALVGIAVVLSSVFIPMAFFPGSAGVIYRQFSVTIVSAMILSVIVAIVLSPALCATILKNTHGNAKSWINKPGDLFNSGFRKLEHGYTGVVERVIRRRWVFFGVFLIIGAVAAFGFVRLPTSFLPDEDQGVVITVAQLPVDASKERTIDVMDRIGKHYMEKEGDNIKGVFTISGFSFAGAGQNMGLSFLPLKDWKDREGLENNSFNIANRTSQAFAGDLEAMVFAINPPPIRELGNASGFDMYLQDLSGVGGSALANAQMQLLGMASQEPTLMGVRPNGISDSPEFNVEIDYQKAASLGIQLSDITNVLSVGFGGTYVNDFLDRGRIKRVYVQGDAEYRMQPDDFGEWRVRNSTGELTPIEEIISTQWKTGSPQLKRFDGLPALNIQGMAAPGTSSGDALVKMEELVSQLPGNYAAEWVGMSAQEKESGNQANALYLLSVLFIFLCLAALYESWTVPLAVLLVAPLGVTGAIAAAHFFDLANDVFFQVGILTTVGLASKNAILIIEFARSLEDQGKELIEATLEAVRMRLRPILMTSFAFGFGVLPLALATGAGAGARVAIGITVVGGLISATFFAIFFAPLFYVIIRKLTGGKSNKSLPPAEGVSA
ncbi:efflux RND transporter permease subunit [Hirschia litorea]|uniref:Efflux pump membrane transporter n=1 Tax=Hirschia litorea TaxID=1199156 RepID=A0ABW2IP18_9PROT